MEIYDLLSFASKGGASDLHLSAGSPPIIRLHGQMKKMDVPALSREEVHRLIYDLMNDDQRRHFEENLELDFSRELKGVGRFRINVFSDYRGECAAFRTIDPEILSFEALHLPDVLKELALLEMGLVLVTGPTGSGKSTTLAAMIDFINTSLEKHIITVEDPIEYLHTSKKSLVNQRELGENTHSFSNALRAALREDPDVILVGEMRDLETTSLAITAAETGHLVFSTLHTMGAAKTVDRIVDQYPANQQAQVRTILAESIAGVVSQILLRRKDGKGRVAAFEIMVATPGIRNMIREEKTFQLDSALQTGGAQGMQTMDQSLAGLVKDNVVDLENALVRARERQFIEKAAGKPAGRPKVHSAVG